MFELFLFFSQVATWISIITLAMIGILSIVFCIMKKDMPQTEEIYKNLSTCKKASIIFVVLSWLFVSGESMESNLDNYMEIADTCLKMGAVWIVVAFLNLAISLALNLIVGKSSKQTEMLNKTRKSTFIVGIVFCALAMLLDVA